MPTNGNVRIIVATEAQSNVVDDTIRKLIEGMRIELTLEQQAELHEKMRDVFFEYIEDKLICELSDEEMGKLEQALDDGTINQTMFAESVERGGIDVMGVINESIDKFRDAFYVSVDRLEEPIYA